MGMEVVLMQPYVVLVLYQTLWNEVAAKDLLTKWLTQNRLAGLLIYDNSPKAQQHPDFHLPKVTYQHHPENLGIAIAYQTAYANLAQEINWLMLLDQDTQLTEDYLKQAEQVIKTNHSNLAAIVPKVFADNRQISPIAADQYIRSGFQEIASGITNNRIMAINSGSIWQRDFLNMIGGFNLTFPLDFLDHWLFYMVYQKQWQVAILNTHLLHDLSVFNYDKVSSVRYQSILTAESRYYTFYETKWLATHRKQLLKRMAKQFLTVKNRRIWKLTFKAYWQLSKERNKS